MTRETPDFHAGQSGSDADGRLVPPQSPYWDLDLLTPDDVCALLKVKKSWLYDVVESGALEAIRLGKQLRFRPSAVVVSNYVARKKLGNPLKPQVTLLATWGE